MQESRRTLDKVGSPQFFLSGAAGDRCRMKRRCDKGGASKLVSQREGLPAGVRIGRFKVDDIVSRFFPWPVPHSTTSSSDRRYAYLHDAIFVLWAHDPPGVGAPTCAYASGVMQGER